MKFEKLKKINFFKNFGKKGMKLINDLILAAQEVTKGNYDYELDLKGGKEISELSKLLNKMIREIKNNHIEMNLKNSYLKETLEKIEAIEKILIGLYIENGIESAVSPLLKALTSEMGLGYSRAMYFRYSRELDSFIGERTSVNPSVIIKNTNEFQFQIDEFDSLVKSIKVPYSHDNLIGRALKEQKVHRFNEKAYKYDLGNDLFKGLGIQNFLILPIYAKNRNYGCIIVDYFAKNKTITDNEYELIKLLIINISIRITNKLIEEERVDSERENTIRKLTERFLGDREKYIENVYALIRGYREGKTDLNSEISDIEEILEKLIKENKSLKEYSELGITRTEKINLEDIFYEIKKEVEEITKKKGATISIFANYAGSIYGNKSDLKKAFSELMKNSYLALLNSDVVDKKINVIISKDKKIDKIRVNIIDNGTGIKPEILESIYIPFLKIDGKVPGLGLSLVYRVIKEHQGVIKFFSKEGEGTDVKITLNAYKEEIF